MRILRCHRCAYIWVYRGRSKYRICCPSCGSSLTLTTAGVDVPITWDYDAPAPGTARFAVRVWNGSASLIALLRSDDGLADLPLPVDAVDIAGELFDREVEAFGENRPSGVYPATGRIKETLCAVFSAP